MNKCNNQPGLHYLLLELEPTQKDMASYNYYTGFCLPTNCGAEDLTKWIDPIVQNHIEDIGLGPVIVSSTNPITALPRN